jgi:tetratricopeptide (TPR) repeat protein
MQSSKLTPHCLKRKRTSSLFCFVSSITFKPRVPSCRVVSQTVKISRSARSRSGQSLQTENAAGIFGLQMFMLRREQGRLKEVEPVLRYFVQQHGALAAWGPGLALLYCELGLTEEALSAFEPLAQHDFTDLPRDALWMACMIYLVDICMYLGDVHRVAILHEILLPFAERNVVIASGVFCCGALSRYLGALATVMGRWDEAAKHFEDAMAMNARMEAWPWLAHNDTSMPTCSSHGANPVTPRTPLCCSKRR